MPLDPQAAFLLEAAALLDLPSPPDLDPETARAAYNHRTDAVTHFVEMDSIDNCEIEGPDGIVPIRLYRPPGVAATAPAVVFFHGGGWVWSTLDNYDAICRVIAAEARAVVVSVEYRLAPEHPFPAAADDCLAATKWVVDNSASIGVDPARVAVCGDSAGGNLAAVVAQDCRDAGVL